MIQKQSGMLRLAYQVAYHTGNLAIYITSFLKQALYDLQYPFCIEKYEW